MKKKSLFNRIGFSLLALVCGGVFCVSTAFSAESVRAQENYATVFSTNLTGRGEKDQPYLITKMSDLVDFRNDVNSGNTYAGKYVALTVDLDLSILSNFTPIGVPGSGNYFCGTFDGQGHRISELRMVQGEGTGSDLALFGTLGGTVMNLGVESGYISGRLAATFAVNASSPDARILNCYSRAYVSGTVRGGGVTDDFQGVLSNCWYKNELSNAPLCSFYAKEMYYCYAVGDLTAEPFMGKIVNSREIGDFFVDTAEFATLLNVGVLTTAMNLYYTSTELKQWSAESGAIGYTATLPTWEGAGTAVKPYLVQTVSDLLLLNVKVNLEGENFSGKYFRQTEHLDLTDVYNFLPIGVYGSLRYFFGTYDGTGHTISNLIILSIDKTPTGVTLTNNNGFFGMLGGIVKNLGFESGSVEGACCASISSHAAANTAQILNCYSKVRVNGSTRSGGIVDNFTGSVVNTFYFNVAQNILMVSYSCRLVRHCYGTGGIYNAATNWGDVVDCEIGINSYTHYSDVCADLNEWITEYARSYRSSNSNYAEWKLGADGELFFDGNFEVGNILDGSDIGEIVLDNFGDEVIVAKLVLCSTVVIVLSVVLDVMLRDYREKKKEREERKEEDER